MYVAASDRDRALTDAQLIVRTASLVMPSAYSSE